MDGEAFEFPTGSRFLGPLLCDRRVLTSSDILQSGMDLGPSSSADNQPRAFLCALLESGYFYPCDAQVQVVESI